MPRKDQPELIEEDSEPDLFGRNPTPVYRPDPDRVRARLRRILEETRAVERLEPSTLSLYRKIFPQMTLFLPEDEGAQLRFAFEQEAKRLEAA